MRKILALVLAALMVVLLTGCSIFDYKKAAEAMEAGDYEAAQAIYEELGDYKDSADLANECGYQVAKAKYDSGDFAAAVEGLTALGDYKDSADLLADAQDQLIKQTLVGNWISGEIDGTEQFLEGMNGALTGEGEDFAKHFDFSSFKIKCKLEFTDQGTVVESIDEDSFNATIEELKASFSKAIVAYMEETMKEEAEANGMAYEDLLNFYDAANTEELIAASMGQSADELTESLLGSMLAELGNIEENGTYTVENGEITLNVGDESEKGTFDIQKGELTLTGEGVPEEQKGMYPMVFTKN